MSKGLIANIERFCINDGSGIRSSVFLMGCPLRCKWCSNPETWFLKPRIAFIEELCNGCGKCVDICNKEAIELINGKISIDRDKCDRCGDCVEECMWGAIKIFGRYYDVDELVEELLKDIIFYEESGGGVTITGGEPAVQMKFLEELCFKLKKNDIHIALDTCGYFDFKRFSIILKYLDLILFDLKLVDDNLHRFYTGVSNEKIINNLFKIDKYSIPIHLRLIAVEDINDSVDEINEKVKLIKEMKNVSRVDILPCHNLGLRKYEWLNMDSPAKYKFKPPEGEVLKILRKKLIDVGVECHIHNN